MVESTFHSRLRILTILLILCLIVASALLVGCGDEAAPSAPQSSAPPFSISDLDTGPAQEVTDEEGALIDPRMEAVAIVFRLAGHDEYQGGDSAYLREVDEHFGAFRDHEAVRYAATLDITGTDVAQFAMRINPAFDGLGDLKGILGHFDDRWTEESATQFYEYLVDFYNDSGFAEFYNQRLYDGSFDELAQVFLTDPRITNLDIAWFVNYAQFQQVPTEFAFLVSPMISKQSFAVRDDKTNYAVLSAVLAEAGQMPAESLVHEFVHSFGDGFGIRWFMEDEAFAALAEATPPIDGYGGDPFDLALEYIVRAYTVKYFNDQGDTEAAQFSMQRSKDLGFIHMDEVYAMIQEYVVPGHPVK